MEGSSVESPGGETGATDAGVAEIIVYHPRRAKQVTMVAISLGFGLIGLWSLKNGLGGGQALSDQISSAMLALLFLPLGIIAITNAMRGFPRLTLTPQGVKFEVAVFSSWANWDSVGPFEVITTEFGTWRKRRVLTVSAIVTGPNASKAARRRKKLVIPDYFDVPLSNIVWDLNAHRMRATGATYGAADGHAMDPVSAATASKKFRVPVVTGSLLALLIVVYILELMTLGGPTPVGSRSNGSALILLGGGNWTFIVEQGQWYRLVTETLLHSNFLHIFGNGIVLLFCGSLLESKIGRAWFLALYVVSGLGGSCMSLVLNAANVNSVGASGAIMGVLAGAFVLTFRDSADSRKWHARFSLLRLLIPALLPSAAAQHIDIFGHLGGAIAGALLATFLVTTWERGSELPKFQRLAKAIPLVVLPILLIGLPSGIATGFLFQGESAEKLGHYPEAEAAFGRAIGLQPKFVDEAVSERAMTRFAMGRYSDAADDFNALSRLKPGWAYAPLFSHVSRFRAGQDDREELAASAKGIDLAKWPGPALALFLQRATPDDVLRAAARAEATKNENQSCEASFYVGEWNLMQGALDQATPLIRKAAETCPAEFYEHRLAAAELARSR